MHSSVALNLLSTLFSWGSHPFPPLTDLRIYLILPIRELEAAESEAQLNVLFQYTRRRYIRLNFPVIESLRGSCTSSMNTGRRIRFFWGFGAAGK